MSLLNEFIFLIIVCSLNVSKSYAKQQLLSEWISYPIDNLQDESVQQIISNSIESLSNTGSFHIKNFLSNKGLSLLQQKMSLIEKKRNRKLRSKNVFQDAGDLNNFHSKQHPRNYEREYIIGFIGKSGLSKEFIDLYLYEPLLNFFKEIVINTYHINNDTFDCKTYSNLYLSAAEEGSVYAYIAQNEDKGNWHFDQHPFSCVWTISKPNKGGQLSFKWTPPKINKNYTNYYERKLGYDWDFLYKIIIDQNEEFFNTLTAFQGDLYCFKGNVTIHQVEQVFGDKLRAVLITAYADYPNFTHIPEINNVNAWGTYQNDKKKEL